MTCCRTVVRRDNRYVRLAHGCQRGDGEGEEHGRRQRRPVQPVRPRHGSAEQGAERGAGRRGRTEGGGDAAHPGFAAALLHECPLIDVPHHAHGIQQQHAHEEGAHSFAALGPEIYPRPGAASARAAVSVTEATTRGSSVSRTASRGSAAVRSTSPKREATAAVPNRPNPRATRAYAHRPPRPSPRFPLTIRRCTNRRGHH